jgi:hypothetical protein
MKCAVITINFFYDGKIINHAEVVPRSSTSTMPAAGKNRGFLVLWVQCAAHSKLCLFESCSHSGGMPLFYKSAVTKCRRYAVLMPGFKIFHACLTSSFRLNGHTFPNNIQSNPAEMLLFGRAPKFLHPILYPILPHPIAIS